MAPTSAGAYPILPLGTLPSGGFYVSVTAPWPSTLELSVNGIPLDTASGSNMPRIQTLLTADSGWYNVASVTPNATNTVFTTKLAVVPPPSDQVGSQFVLAVRDSSLNSAYGVSAPLLLTFTPAPVKAPVGSLWIIATFKASYACNAVSLPCQISFPGSVVFAGTRTTGSGSGVTCMNDQQGSGCAYVADDNALTAMSQNCGSSSTFTPCQSVQVTTPIISGLAAGTWQITATATSPDQAFKFLPPNPLMCQTLTITGQTTATLLLNFTNTTGCH